MNNKLSITFLQSELIRVSEWIKFADQKATILSGFYTLIIGFVLSNKKLNITFFNCYEVMLIGILSISVLLGFFYILKAIFPKLENVNTNDSCFYYGTIASKKPLDFLKRMDEITEESAKVEIIEQIHTNSVIAKTKMDNVKLATIFSFVALVSSVLFYIS